MRLYRLFCVFVVLFSFGSKVHGQEKVELNEAVMPLKLLKVFSVNTNLNLGVAKANFTRGTSAWLHPFGYNITGGVGASFLLKNSFGAEVNFSYELISYLYKNTNVNLSLGYRAPYADLKLKKVFNTTEDNSFYAKLGGGYMFGGTGGTGKTETNYSYSINFVSTSMLMAFAEIGKQKRLGKKSYMEIGVVYKYGFNPIIASTMSYVESTSPLVIQNASSTTNGSYIGVSIKYFNAFKIIKPKVTSRAVPDKRF